FLALLLTLSTLLLLTTQNPIDRFPSARVPSKIKSKFPSARVARKSDILVVNNKSGGCDLKIVNMFDCDANITIDKTRKCEELRRDEEFKGKVCGKGDWKVMTFNEMVATYHDGVGSKVTWRFDPKKGF
ncbi:MAG: hypothetical protein Q9172_007817, partial [Xanthocarpia lactea]